MLYIICYTTQFLFTNMFIYLQGDIHTLYSNIDKETPTSTDRQVYQFTFNIITNFSKTQACQSTHSVSRLVTALIQSPGMVEHSFSLQAG